MNVSVREISIQKAGDQLEAAMVIRPWWFSFGVLVLAMAFVCSMGWAVEDRKTIEKPHQAKEISVGVSVIYNGSENEGIGLSADQIRSDVELQLQVAKIKVLPFEESSQWRGPYLFVSAIVAEPNPDEYKFVCSIEIKQGLVTGVHPDILALTSVWQTRVLAKGEEVGDIKGVIGGLVEQFLASSLPKDLWERDQTLI
jgi:hypothetical protein